jgi:hypothetical protein
VSSHQEVTRRHDLTPPRHGTLGPGETPSGSYLRMLRWYPSAWRARYGDELVALMEDSYESQRHIPLRDRVDLARSGLVERARAIRMFGSSPSSSDRVRDGSVLVLCGWALFLIAGGGFAKFTDRWKAGSPTATRTLAGFGFDTAVVAGIAGCALVLIAAVVVGPSFARLIGRSGWERVRRPVVLAVAALTFAVAALGAITVWAHHLSPIDRNGGLPVYSAMFVAMGVLVVAAVGMATAAAVVVGRQAALERKTMRVLGILAVALTAVMVLLLAGIALWWGAEASGAPHVMLDGIGNGVPYLSSTLPPTLLGAGLLMLVGLALGAGGSLRVLRSLGGLGRLS